jgi:predicted DNA-binding transcriptional regulator AlpA
MRLQAEVNLDPGRAQVETAKGTVQKLLYTTEEISEATGVPVETYVWWRQINEGPPYVKLGRNVRYSLKAVMQYIERKTHDPARGMRRKK